MNAFGAAAIWSRFSNCLRRDFHSAGRLAPRCVATKDSRTTFTPFAEPLVIIIVRILNVWQKETVCSPECVFRDFSQPHSGAIRLQASPYTGLGGRLVPFREGPLLIFGRSSEMPLLNAAVFTNQAW